jgi:hypothetical protein
VRPKPVSYLSLTTSDLLDALYIEKDYERFPLIKVEEGNRPTQYENTSGHVPIASRDETHPFSPVRLCTDRIIEQH